MKIEGPMHPCDKMIIESQNNVIKTCLQIIENQRAQLEAMRLLK